MIQLQPNERVVRVFRRHWIVLSLTVLQILIGIGAAVVLPSLIGFVVPEIAAGYRGFIVLGSALMAQCLWVTLFFVVADYYLDTWIVTNERLVFIELKGLFSRTVSSMNFRNIQDVSTEVHGILETVFKFGDVRIQSAGTEGSFVFRQVGNPYAVKDLILEIRANEEGGGSLGKSA